MVLSKADGVPPGVTSSKGAARAHVPFLGQSKGPAFLLRSGREIGGGVKIKSIRNEGL